MSSSLENSTTDFHASGDTVFPRTSLLVNGGSSALGNGSMRGDILSKFEDAKNEMIEQFMQLRKTTKSLSSFTELTKGQLEISLDETPVSSAILQIDYINDVISRDQMKVAFFGRTSSGKSTVANAILGGKILPVGMGDTTNCFITMQGTNQPEPFMIHPLHPESPQSVHSVAQLAHALDKNKLQRNSQLMIFWPSDKVELLQHDIQLIDSPGISVDVQTDTWIDKYCLDADVFIFVASAESTIMETEKQFFYKVSQHLSKPNMFILQNKWDLADSSDIDPDGVKKQHVERSIEFLVDELKVMDDLLEAEKRVFFISAKEELNFRIQELKGQQVHIDGEYRSAIEERRREFKAFEKDFRYCVCDTAIKTKFEKHTEKGMQIMQSLTTWLQNLSEEAKRKRADAGKDHENFVKLHKQMRTRAKKLEAFKKQQVLKFVQEVQAKVATAMGEEIMQLPLLLEKFPRPFPSDISGMAAYKSELFDFLDKELKNAIDARFHRDIVKTFDSLRSHIISQAELVIPQFWIDKQSKSVSIMNLSSQRVNPDLNFSISCQSVCAGFQEDLSFSFSLGLNNILSKIFGSRRLLKTKIPKSGSDNEGTNDNSDSQSENFLLPILATFSALPSMGPLGLMIVGGIVWSKISWKMIGVVAGGYGGIYLYERLTWNVVAKQRTFKRQVVDYATPQLSTVIPIVSNHCSDMLSTDIQTTYSMLRVDIDASLLDVHEDITAREREMKKLNDFVETSATYATKLQDHGKIFSGFLQKFLKM